MRQFISGRMRRVVFVALGLSLLCVTLIAWTQLEAQEGGSEAQVLKIQAVIESSSRLTQTVMSSKSSGADGEVADFKRVGDKVKKGDEVILLKYLNGKELELKATLHVAVDHAHGLEALLEWNRHLEAMANKLATTAAVAPEEREKRKLAAIKAKYDHHAAEEAIIVAKGRSSPYNPAAQIDGEVISVHKFLTKGFQIADFASPLELMRIADLKELEVVITVPMKDRHRIEGYSVMPLRDKKERPGREARVARLSNQMLEISVAFDNADGQIRPYEAAEVRVRLK